MLTVNNGSPEAITNKKITVTVTNSDHEEICKFYCNENFHMSPYSVKTIRLTVDSSQVNTGMKKWDYLEYDVNFRNSWDG